MYIPKQFEFTDKTEIVAFMKQFSFATIVTARDNKPVATHLPFVVSYENDNIVLTSHFARANNQWKDIETNDVLVIFSEPHAYISPRHYDRKQNVPTWNYLAVHAYGHGKIISDMDEVLAILEYTIMNYEATFKQQWDNLSHDYKHNLAQEIVAFNIFVTDIQATKKLSQNKTENERQTIIHSFEKSDDTNEQHIAQFMKREKK